MRLFHWLLAGLVVDNFHAVTSETDSDPSESTQQQQPRKGHNHNRMLDQLDGPNDVQSDSSEVFQTIHVNCGSSHTYTDFDGKVWEADNNFDGGEVVVQPDSISEGENDPVLYQTLRRTSNGQNHFSYKFEVPNGDYVVAFHFVDLVNEIASARTFDIWAEGRILYRDFDIVAQAEAANRQLIARRRVIVLDGSIDIVFANSNGRATISAMEIVERKRPPTVAAPTIPTGIPSLKPTPLPVTQPAPTPLATVVLLTPGPTRIPKAQSTALPTVKPSAIETTTPTRIPADEPTEAPLAPPTSIPTASPSAKATVKPTSTPENPVPVHIINVGAIPTIPSLPLPTTNKPTHAPSKAPIPILQPVAAGQQQSPVFEPLRINSGGRAYTDPAGNFWIRDQYFSSGSVYSRYWDIWGTDNDVLYATERFGSFRYDIPLPVANYEVILYFTEHHFDTQGSRQFSIKIQNELVFDRVDLIALSAGQKLKEVTLETSVVVSDGLLSIEFVSLGVGSPKLNALEIILSESHLAHAVTSGPYVAVDIDGDNFAVVSLDGTLSHTHGYGLTLTSWEWLVGQQVLATGESTSVTLPVGKHFIQLVVKDSGGNENADSTTIEVRPQGFPYISSLEPNTGKIAGGDIIEISGNGFENVIYVHFGRVKVEVTTVSSTTIRIKSPLAFLATLLDVKVETALGISNAVSFTYIDGSPIAFSKGRIAQIPSPTTLAFGPDSKLYIGTAKGQFMKLKLDSNYNVIESVSSSIIGDLEGNRMILGIAFDPMDVFSENPSVYVSHSEPFHGSTQSSSSSSTNGKVSRVSGANLGKSASVALMTRRSADTATKDMIEHIVEGLPVSDHDHAVNGLEFGDNGDLYIQVAGSTNAGVPGRLSSTRLLKDNVLSGATLVAHLAHTNFTGRLKYDATDDGNLLPGSGVEIFAFGLRNPYSLTLHSNGKLYGTDNGPNKNFGYRSTDCNSELPVHPEEDDKILLLEKDHYYGHPNRKRGETDPRQCVWRSVTDPSQGKAYTAPLATNPSSIDGIIEFQTDHFGGQLRHNLIVAKYKKELYRVILNEDGTAVLPISNPPIPLTGGNTLDVAQAPDGTLVVTQYIAGAVAYYKPVEPSDSSQLLRVYGVFPRRGPAPMTPLLTVYYSSIILAIKENANVIVGDAACPIQSITSNEIVCGPATADQPGTVDVTVVISGTSQVFRRGFRFITGQPTAA